MAPLKIGEFWKKFWKIFGKIVQEIQLFPKFSNKKSGAFRALSKSIFGFSFSIFGALRSPCISYCILEI